jgi:hypothetical protein
MAGLDETDRTDALAALCATARRGRLSTLVEVFPPKLVAQTSSEGPAGSAAMAAFAREVEAALGAGGVEAYGAPLREALAAAEGAEGEASRFDDAAVRERLAELRLDVDMHLDCD